MPTSYIKKLAKQGKGSIATLEKKWALARSVAKAEGQADNYAYITTIFKSELGIKSAVIDSYRVVGSADAIVAPIAGYYTAFKNTTILMKPSQFLNLAKPFDLTGEKSLNQERVNFYINQKHWMTHPMLVISTNAQGRLKVVNQDGRHRSLAALQEGTPILKVDIFMSISYHEQNPETTNVELAELIVSNQELVGYSVNF